LSQPRDPIAAQPSAAEAPPPPPAVPAAAPDSGGLVFEPVKEATAPGKGTAVHPGHRPAWRPPVTAAAKPVATAKPAVTTAAAAQPPKSGFVPPPVTNPGF
jgi:hypothetical protein